MNHRATVEETAAAAGCLFAQNAGFFSTNHNWCLGNVVSDGRMVQDSGGIQNAQFGIRRDGTLVFGYDQTLARPQPLFEKTNPVLAQDWCQTQSRTNIYSRGTDGGVHGGVSTALVNTQPERCFTRAACLCPRLIGWDGSCCPGQLLPVRLRRPGTRPPSDVYSAPLWALWLHLPRRHAKFPSCKFQNGTFLIQGLIS